MKSYADTKGRKRVGLPLYGRILGWFFLNLLLLAVLVVVFIRTEFHVGFDSLLLREAEGRIDAVGRVIAEELRNAPQDEWSAILKRFGAAYAVSFYLIRPDGEKVAGDVANLPDAVIARVREHAPRPRPRPEGEPGPPRLRAEGPPPPFHLRTEKPTQHWLGVMLPIFPRGEMEMEPRPLRGSPMDHGERPRMGGRRGPGFLVLLAMSPSLTGGPFFIDPRPWLGLAAIALALCVLFWLPFVRGITRSISQMTRATEQIAEGQFEIALPGRRRDELGRLSQGINQMASRLSGYVSGQKRFLGGIAHELCSPIARAELALSILEERAGQHKLQTEDLREEIEQMRKLVNELLSFSKAALSGPKPCLEAVHLAELAGEVIRREASEGTTLKANLPANLHAIGDKELLRRALGNVVRNAIRYAGNAGPISISGSAEDEYLSLSVTDYGPGVPEEALPKLFDPFFRVDEARSRESGGVGLGLAIVKSCVEACGGTVSCHNLTPKGFAVVFRLRKAP